MPDLPNAHLGAAAPRIRSATSCGREMSDKWLESISIVVATVRLVTASSLNQCNANTMIADVPFPPKNPETTPEVVATYCLPPTS